MGSLKALNKYILKYKLRFISGIIFIIISNIFAIFPAQVIRRAFDLVKEQLKLYSATADETVKGNIYDTLVESIFIFGLIVIGLAIMRGLFMFFMRQTIIVMSRLIEFDLKNDVYKHYSKMDMAFYKKNMTGDLMSRITEDVSRVRMYLGPAIMYSINLGALFIVTIYMMLSVNVQLTLYVLLPLPILSFSIYFVSSRINKRSEAIQKQLSHLTSIAQESFSGIRIIKSFVQEKSMKAFFDSECEEYKDRTLSLARVESLFFPLMLLLTGLSTILTIYLGGLKVISGEITTGNIAEFVIYINMLTWPIASVGWVASLIQRAEASQKRINEFLQVEPVIHSGTVSLTDKNSINIRFENVGFVYPDTGIEAIKNFSLDIKPGDKIAIMGKTGSGKSTVANLLTRLYDVTKGNIKINSNNIKELDLERLRSLISYVPQDVFLFSDTISNNIAFSANDAEKELIVQAAELASIKKEIGAIPKQFDNLIGERGVTLSGGQKQRISLARALLKDSPVLLLDDCLSAVDATTEKKIVKNLGALWEDKTVIIITHRIITSLNFDKIVILDSGSVLESGTHDELLQKNGYYKELFDNQNKQL